MDRCHKEYGSMWECPDYFTLDGKQVILVSPQDMLAQDLEFHNGNGTMYLLGEYRKEAALFRREKVAAIDYGLDFYAPQTLETQDGRRVMIGWMQSWDNHITPAEFAWSGIMSIPRELQIRNQRLIQNPVRELENYYHNPVSHQGVVIGEGEDGPGTGTELAGIKGRQIDMTMDIDGQEDSYVEIALASNDLYRTRLIYDAKCGTLTFDRQYAGMRRDVIHQRTMQVTQKEGRIRLRILMDRYTVEVFVNDGEQAMSSLIYTPMEADGIRFYSKEKVVLTITKYDIVVE